MTSLQKHKHTLILLSTNRIWFWLKDPTDDAVSQFNWGRDSIYGATILMGIGGATMVVISMTLVAYIVGPHTVSRCMMYHCKTSLIPRHRGGKGMPVTKGVSAWLNEWRV